MLKSCYLLFKTCKKERAKQQVMTIDWSKWHSWVKVKILWKSHKIWKHHPPALTKQLLLLSSVKISGRFYQIFVAFSEKLDFITSRGFYSSRLNGATCGSLEWPPSGAFQVERGKLYFAHQMVSQISNLRILFFPKNHCCYLHRSIWGDFEVTKSL